MTVETLIDLKRIKSGFPNTYSTFNLCLHLHWLLSRLQCIRISNTYMYSVFDNDSDLCTDMNRSLTFKQLINAVVCRLSLSCDQSNLNAGRFYV